MEKIYIDYSDECYRIKDTRVSLDSVVYAFKEGLSPEAISTECFPVLTLEQIYGAITFYLANREKIDIYLKKNEVLYKELRARIYLSDSEFYQKLKYAQRQIESVGV